MLATSKQNFFNQKFCTGCTSRINISNKKTILQQAVAQTKQISRLFTHHSPNATSWSQFH